MRPAPAPDRLTFRIFLRYVISAGVGLTVTVASYAGGLPDFTVLVEKNSPAVVNISTTIEGAAHAKKHDRASRDDPPAQDGPEGNPLNDFFRKYLEEQEPEGGEESRPRSSLGSGFIIGADGYVISNYHVVKGANEVMVRLSDRRELKAKVVGMDARSDIAVLKIETRQKLPTLRLGNSSKLKVGEWVLAIGSPFGFDHSVTAGIVSAKGRSLPNENYVPFIQTDAAINPGNSGGPLFNLDGEVIGVNSQIFSRTGGFMGLSFAIPIDVVVNVYRQIREKGEVSRGWLGVLIQDVTPELSESFQMTGPHGALVSKVLAGSPAEHAGVETGDVIVKFNGESIANSADLPPLVGQIKANEKIPMQILRQGKPRDFSITIGALPAEDQVAVAEKNPQEAPHQRIPRLQISVRELTSAEREETGLAGPGVLAEEVGAGPAADAGLQPQDIILQLNFKEVGSVSMLEKLTESLTQGTKVPLLINRQGRPLFMAIAVSK